MVKNIYLPAEKTRQPAILAVVIGLLATGCAAIWYPVYEIQRNGVVIFSCTLQIHIPIWVALVQGTALVNIILMSFTVEKIAISLKPPRRGQGKHNSVRGHSVILRCHKNNIKAQAIRWFTSILSMALYTYATGVFSGMTMYPASDGIRALVPFGIVAGIGRIITSLAATKNSRWKKTIVFQVQQRHLKFLEQYINDDLLQSNLLQTTTPTPNVSASPTLHDDHQHNSRHHPHHRHTLIADLNHRPTARTHNCSTQLALIRCRRLQPTRP